MVGILVVGESPLGRGISSKISSGEPLRSGTLGMGVGIIKTTLYPRVDAIACSLALSVVQALRL